MIFLLNKIRQNESNPKFDDFQNLPIKQIRSTLDQFPTNAWIHFVIDHQNDDSTLIKTAPTCPAGHLDVLAA